MITFKHKGNFHKIDAFFRRVEGRTYIDKLNSLGQEGVAALREATPKDTGKTSESWSYEIIDEPGSVSIVWSNNNINNYVNIAVILQYGHATRNGGWVEGRDYINPAMQPIFDKIADKAWKEVVGR